ncbi:NADPH-dependent FMN reductase [Halosegnis marinus]|uniref:NADPH-dependent FMN reductase n=1 Tax=Halosegnis marinus TaxID=3034023 RepID=A0ABD5ZSC6_9EURY|nr:NAD(P)H-dependent oxidoreductase [Halosegnis sp. DT85]
MDTIHVAALVGSLREASYTRLACRRALAVADEYDRVETDLIDLRTLDLPTYNGDRDDPPGVTELLERVAAADAVLLGTPNYHGSYSGVLKNALDYCGFDEFEDTTVGLLVVAGGAYSSAPLDHLRIVARSVNAWVIPHQVAIQGASSRFEDGVLVDEKHAERVDTLGRRLVEYANIEPDPPTQESESNVGADD